mmetsp:Transcript_17297/g.19351  ORF Transcript_17297/g.19351 Transcript_17297/m.19351 type:complete len:247 (+) Transcript_17297:346-1086(+)
MMELQYKNVFKESKGLSVTFPDREHPNINIGTVITILVFLFLGMFIIFGTIIDRTSLCQRSGYVAPQRRENDQNEDSSNDYIRKNAIGNFFSSFSIPRNFKRIFIDSFAMHKELRVLNGVYVISLILVILNNTYFISSMYGIVEATSMINGHKNLFNFLLIRLHLVYELYFFSIGFICTIKLWTMTHLHHYNGYVFMEILRLIYRRWLPMVFIMLYTLFIFQYTGTGPLFQFCFNNWIIGTNDFPH